MRHLQAKQSLPRVAQSSKTAQIQQKWVFLGFFKVCGFGLKKRDFSEFEKKWQNHKKNTKSKKSP